MQTYRAAYLTSAQSSGVVLTRPEHANLPDAELIKEALAEAERAGIETTADEIEIGDWISLRIRVID